MRNIIRRGIISIKMYDNDIATSIAADCVDDGSSSKLILWAYFAVADGRGAAFAPEELQLGTERTVVNFVIALLTAAILTALLAFVVMRRSRGVMFASERPSRRRRRRRRVIEEGAINMADSKMKKIEATRTSLFLRVAIISTTAAEERGTVIRTTSLTMPTTTMTTMTTIGIGGSGSNVLRARQVPRLWLVARQTRRRSFPTWLLLIDVIPSNRDNNAIPIRIRQG
jgi:hypothetical protein